MSRQIWFVDDSDELWTTFGGILTDAGFVVRPFRDQDSVFAEWAGEDAEPDVLIVNVRRGGINEIDLIRRVRQRSQKIALILATEIDSESSTINALESGADDVILKPVSIAEMIARLNVQLKRQTQLTQIRQQTEDFRLLMELSNVLSRSTSVARTLRDLIDGLRGALGVEAAAVYMTDPQTGELHRALPTEPSRTEATPNVTLDLRDLPSVADGLAARTIVRLEQPDTITLMRAIGGFWPNPNVTRSSAVFPMILHEEYIGALVIVAQEERFGWRARDQYISSIIADFAAVAVHREIEPHPVRGELTTDETSRELQKTRDYFSNLVASSPDAIVAADSLGAVFVMNRAAEAILGYDFQEIAGMDVRKLYPPGGAEKLLKRMRESPDGRVERHKGTLVRHNGEHVPVEISASIVFERGEEAATVGIFTDLRGRLEMQEQLQAAHDSLEESQRKAVLAELAGAAAHELNQPLTSLLGFVELLDKRLGEESEHNRLVRSIANESSRVAEIVRQIGTITDYKTKEYLPGTQILDLEQASEVEEVPPEIDFFDWVPTAVGFSDSTGSLVRLNKAARDFLGVDEDQAVRLDLAARVTSQKMVVKGGEFYISDVRVVGSFRDFVSVTMLPVMGGAMNRVVFEVPESDSRSPSAQMLDTLTSVLKNMKLMRTREKILTLFVKSFHEVFPDFAISLGQNDVVVTESAPWAGALRTSVGPSGTAGHFDDPDRLFWADSQRGFRTKPNTRFGSFWVQVEKQDPKKFSYSEREAFEMFAQQATFAVGRSDDGMQFVAPLINQLNAIVAICNPKREIQVSNETFDQLAHGAEVIGQDIISFFGEGKDQVRSAIAAVLAGGVVEPFHASIEVDGRPGIQLQIRVHANRSGDPSAAPRSVVVIGQQSELSLQAIDKKMERAEQLFSLGHLATGVAHELKNPLTSILNYADYLRQKYQDSLFDARDAERLTRIIDGVEQIDAFIQDLVTLARPESGPHEYVLLGRVIAEAATMCEVNFDRCSTTLSVETSEYAVRGNHVHLRQVFANLFSNAASAMPANGGQINVSFAATDSEILCIVRDTAVGIEPEVLNRIFEPFFTTRAGHGGSGLGLAIVHQIVKQHSGAIDVRSQVGAGTTFTISLPRHP